ncbi:glycosyltransferase family 4 protein [Streptomyces sp. NPDC046939]|uniref:glycosyltransferase family 4 protein n=1 Tax=Streptomyces sp. NPDC046939 TaxID=3155376 RepID=UPI00340F4C9F
MKIAFLIHNAYGIGGTIRATANLASALAGRGHEVEIVSVIRGVDTPHLPVSAKVRLRPLIDIRKDSDTRETDHPLHQQPSALLPEPEGSLKVFTRLADLRVEQYLTATDADIVIATRPGFLVYLAQFAPDAGFLRIGQEHMTYSSHEPAVREAMDAAIPRLDAYLTVTAQDAATHNELLPKTPRVLRCLPNVVPVPRTEPSDGQSRLIVAAGRLHEDKRFDVLIRAFSHLADERPEWNLRVYGRGPDRARLRTLIDDLGLSDRAFLMGPHSPIETEWAKAAIAVSASKAESFGLTLVEAMHCGVPVISTDCPIGPREIITDGTDGLLIPVDDEAALHTALAKLIDDPARRRALGTAARATAQTYAPKAVSAQFEDVIRELRPGLLPAPAPAPKAPAARAVIKPTPTAVRRLRRTAAALVRPLRRTATAVKPAAKPTPVQAAPTPLKALRPKATCRATADGSLLISLARGGVTGRELTLTARLRGTDGTGPGERLTLPLTPPPSGKGPLTATLARAEHQLAEGRWDFHVERADDGKRARLAVTLVEQARLLTLPLLTAPHGVSAWIPYTTTGGALTLRTWLRRAHAELTQVRVGDDHLTLAATLHGDARTPTLLTLTAPDAPTAVHDIPVIASDHRHFACTIPYRDLLTRHVGSPTTWHITVTTDTGPIPLGRLTGDNVDRKRTDTHPARTLTHATHGPLSLQPRFDPSNDLTLHLKGAVTA